MEKLKRILDPNKVVLNLTAQRNFDAIRELVAVLWQDEVVPDQKHLIAALDSARATGLYGHWQGRGRTPRTRGRDPAPALGHRHLAGWH